MKNICLLVLLIMGFLTGNAQLQRGIHPGSPVSKSAEPIAKAETMAAIRGTVTQDFEGFADFATSITPWSLVDIDGSNTYGITNVDFPHAGEPMAFLVFNPSSTTPITNQDPDLLPHSGYKYAACFASMNPPNNDWLISPLIELGSNGHLKFWVKSYTSTWGLERYRVGISTTTPEPANFTIISAGSYVEAPAEAWQQVDYDLSAYAGMDIFVGIHCVSSDAFIFMVDDFEVTSDAVTGSTLAGKVTDALTGNPIPNAVVTVAGLTDVTDQNGDYSIANIPVEALNASFSATPTSGNAPLNVQFTDLSTESTLTVTASAAGYTSYLNGGVAIPQGGTLNLYISLSPTLNTGQYRFVLTWGEQPLDIDSHLKTPLIEGTAYHVYYGDQGSSTGPPYAILDIDDQDSYGPETTTIYTLYPGEYRYYIYNYSGSPEITVSEAVVQIFNASGLLHTLPIPTTGEGLYWDICTLDGSTGNISIINQITTVEPGGRPFLAPAEMPAKPPVERRSIVSWSWNFGDGATSTERNPSHTYAANGAYHVSLTVSDGVNSNTLTRNSYILVGPIGVDENDWSGKVRIFPNPASTQLHIESPVPVKLARLVDLNGVEIRNIPEAGNWASIDVSSVPKGVYMLQLVTEQGIMTRKVFILSSRNND